jgi:hypothetical protein
LVTVSALDKRLRVEHDGRLKLEDLVRALGSAGYRQVAVLG